MKRVHADADIYIKRTEGILCMRFHWIYEAYEYDG